MTDASLIEYLPEDVQPEILGEECFVMAWPPPDAGHGSVRRSLFDGLET